MPNTSKQPLKDAQLVLLTVTIVQLDLQLMQIKQLSVLSVLRDMFLLHNLDVLSVYWLIVKVVHHLLNVKHVVLGTLLGKVNSVNDVAINLLDVPHVVLMLKSVLNANKDSI